MQSSQQYAWSILFFGTTFCHQQEDKILGAYPTAFPTRLRMPAQRSRSSHGVFVSVRNLLMLCFAFIFFFYCTLRINLTGVGNFATQAAVSQGERRESNVISYSLYGSDPRYTQGAMANARLYRVIFPGWTMRIYHDNTVPRTILVSLRQAGAVLVNMAGSDLNPMTWRFLAASDSTVVQMCSRDLDSRLTHREYLAVSEWANSSFPTHVIRDHPSHMEKRCIMPGGMWCAKKNALKNMHRLVLSYSKATGYDLDQQFLAAMVWPKIKASTMQHVSFGCKEHTNVRPLIPRVGMEHIGAVYLNDELRESDVALLKAAIAEGSEC
jgi:hypothetical protein